MKPSALLPLALLGTVHAETNAGSNGDCSAYPEGPAPVPNPNTWEKFLRFSEYQDMANTAVTPSGWYQTFKNAYASLHTADYDALYLLPRYYPSDCAKFCDGWPGCIGFNIYFERDPLLDPGYDCPNPNATTYIKCALWASPVVSELATNRGHSQGPPDASGEAFRIAIAGSNGYQRAKATYNATATSSATVPSRSHVVLPAVTTLQTIVDIAYTTLTVVDTTTQTHTAGAPTVTTVTATVLHTTSVGTLTIISQARTTERIYSTTFVTVYGERTVTRPTDATSTAHTTQTALTTQVIQTTQTVSTTQTTPVVELAATTSTKTAMTTTTAVKLTSTTLTKTINTRTSTASTLPEIVTLEPSPTTTTSTSTVIVSIGSITSPIISPGSTTTSTTTHTTTLNGKPTSPGSTTTSTTTHTTTLNGKPTSTISMTSTTTATAITTATTIKPHVLASMP